MAESRKEVDRKLRRARLQSFAYLLEPDAIHDAAPSNEMEDPTWPREVLIGIHCHPLVDCFVPNFDVNRRNCGSHWGTREHSRQLGVHELLPDPLIKQQGPPSYERTSLLLEWGNDSFKAQRGASILRGTAQPASQSVKV